MSRHAVATWVAVLAACVVTGCRSTASKTAERSVIAFDVSADPAAELSRSLAAARAAHRRVLVVVGGDWCRFCDSLRKTVDADARITARLRGSYEVMTVAVDKKHSQEEFLSQFPPIKEVPYLFVLDETGKLIEGVGSTPLEGQGPGTQHDPDKVLALLNRLAAQ